MHRSHERRPTVSEVEWPEGSLQWAIKSGKRFYMPGHKYKKPEYVLTILRNEVHGEPINIVFADTRTSPLVDDTDFLSLDWTLEE